MTVPAIPAEVAASYMSEATTEIEDEVCTDLEYNNDNETAAEFTVVHATAVFENSPFSNLVQDDITSLEKFLCSEEHLKKNIMRIELDVGHNWEVNTKLYVRQRNLWEAPRSYIWKFLGGQNFLGKTEWD